jgi:hypothetical protein
MKTKNRTSIDIFAEANPAFCSLILLNFCKGYFHETKIGVPFPLLLLPLPIILSNDLSKSFNGTNVRTGFFRWIKNNPEILLDLTIRINESNEFLKPAIEFGVFKRIFQIDNLGFLIPIENSVKNLYKSELENLFKYSDRLGKWIGQVNSTKTIYNHLGIQL